MSDAQQPPATAMTKIDEAVELIRGAQKINEKLKLGNQVGSDEWRQHENIEDKLHDALAALGQ